MSQTLTWTETRTALAPEGLKAASPEGDYVVLRYKHARKWRFMTPTRGGGYMPTLADAIAHCESVAKATAGAK